MPQVCTKCEPAQLFSQRDLVTRQACDRPAIWCKPHHYPFPTAISVIYKAHGCWLPVWHEWQGPGQCVSSDRNYFVTLKTSFFIFTPPPPPPPIHLRLLFCPLPVLFSLNLSHDKQLWISIEAVVRCARLEGSCGQHSAFKKKKQSTTPHTRTWCFRVIPCACNCMQCQVYGKHLIARSRWPSRRLQTKVEKSAGVSRNDIRDSV